MRNELHQRLCIFSRHGALQVLLLLFIILADLSKFVKETQSTVVVLDVSDIEVDTGHIVIGVKLIQAFSGQGNRLDGKCKTASDGPRVEQSHEIKRFVNLPLLLANDEAVLRAITNWNRQEQ